MSRADMGGDMVPDSVVPRLADRVLHRLALHPAAAVHRMHREPQGCVRGSAGGR